MQRTETGFASSSKEQGSVGESLGWIMAHDAHGYRGYHGYARDASYSNPLPDGAPSSSPSRLSNPGLITSTDTTTQAPRVITNTL